MEHVFRCGGEYTKDVQQRFQAQFPETKVPHRNAVRRLIQKFKETGSVRDYQIWKAISTDREESIGYLRPHAPKPEEVHQEIIPAGSCLTWHGPYSLKNKRLRLHPYKITAVHELKPGDSAKRVAYCKWFLDFLDRERDDILDVTFFTDEAYFHFSG